MKAEVVLQCCCSETRLGDRLVIVGDHPMLGNWDPEKSQAVMQTNENLFPVWDLPAPLELFKDEECSNAAAEADSEKQGITDWVGKRVEYKYVILRAGDQGCEWEDLQWRHSNTHILLNFADVSQVPVGYEVVSAGPPATALIRILPVNRSMRFYGNPLVYCRDQFGRFEPASTLCWQVKSNWCPGVVGGQVAIGDGDECSLRYYVPRRLFVDKRRSELAAACEDMTARHCLPEGLWRLILEFADLDLADRCFPRELDRYFD
mmetsp:Transcript_23379/g.51347  ORF Transcript_23379/g.51347 Transcript_23379/m.51347 type:complete len:262 (+) Transcript_23379:64-849(+)